MTPRDHHQLIETIEAIPWEVPFSLPDDYLPVEGLGVALTEGAEVVLISYGPIMLGEACKAAVDLRETEGIGVKVVNLPWLNRLDPAWLVEIVAGARAVVTLDNHYLDGGQGSMVAAGLAEGGLTEGCVVKRLGLTEVPACGTNDEVLRAHGLDADSVRRAVVELF